MSTWLSGDATAPPSPSVLPERRYRRASNIGVFAVEDTSIQLVWRDLDPGRVALTARVQHEAAFHTSGAESTVTAGGLLAQGLKPGTTYELELRHEDEIVHRQLVTTLTSPPGEELYRIAALNDLHLGCAWFGPFGAMREELADDADPSSVRCAHAGVGAALAWGADRIVLRGDLVHRGDLSDWRAVRALLDRIDVPVDIALGNHETSVRPWRTDLAAGLDTIGVELEGPVRKRELPGTDLLLTDTAVAHIDPGVINHVSAEILEAAASSRPTVLMTHHNLERRREAFTMPRGVPFGAAGPFLDRLAEVSPATLVSSGHTHRHRRRLHRTVPVVEIGSPKDYPGVWCGYVIYEGGIRQVVRRITDPECIGWTERTRTSLGGIWGWWSVGSLSDRCFSHPWPIS
jgi:Icc protein